MALRTNEVFEIGKDSGFVGITGGPNDWNLWLCMRRTITGVCFYTDQPVCVPPIRDHSTFFSARINSMKLLDDSISSSVEWEIKGRTTKCGSHFLFVATYNVQSREGRVSFKS